MVDLDNADIKFNGQNLTRSEVIEIWDNMEVGDFFDARGRDTDDMDTKHQKISDSGFIIYVKYLNRWWFEWETNIHGMQMLKAVHKLFGDK